jgi:hypothetical protein
MKILKLKNCNIFLFSLHDCLLSIRSSLEHPSKFFVGNFSLFGSENTEPIETISPWIQIRHCFSSYLNYDDHGTMGSKFSSVKTHLYKHFPRFF